MDVNLYSQQTFTASKKFAGGETTAGGTLSTVVYMRQTQFLAKWIERRDKIPADVARGTGLSPSYISQLSDTTGKYTKEPKISTLEKIGNFLDIHYAAFEFDPDSVQGKMFAAMAEPKKLARK